MICSLPPTTTTPTPTVQIWIRGQKKITNFLTKKRKRRKEGTREKVIHKLQLFDRNFLDMGLGFASQRIFLWKTNKSHPKIRGPGIINSKSQEFYNISSLISLIYSKLNTTIIIKVSTISHNLL